MKNLFYVDLETTNSKENNVQQTLFRTLQYFEKEIHARIKRLNFDF